MVGARTVVVEKADDPRLDGYRALNDQRFRRKYEGDDLFVAEGLVAVARAIDSGHRVRSILVLDSKLDRLEGDVGVGSVGGPDVDVFVVRRDVMVAVVGFDLHRGVVALGERRVRPSIDDVLAGSGDLAVLEGLNDAENVGVIARAARAFGVAGMVLDPTSTDPYARRSVRVGMGEILHLPVARCDDWPAALERIRSHDVEVWAMTPSTDADDLWDAVARLDPGTRVAVCLGAEGPGLSGRVLDVADRRVRIPIASDVDSLNVGHAAAVTFAVLARRRRPADGRETTAT